MPIHLRREEIERMRIAGKLAGKCSTSSPPRQPGITTGELDRLCHDLIVDEQKRSLPR